MIRVNGELINPNLIEEAYARIKSEAELRAQVSCCEKDEEFSKAAEEEVVDSILIAQEAEKNLQDLDEGEVTKALEEMIQRYREHGASDEMLESEGANLREEGDGQFAHGAVHGGAFAGGFSANGRGVEELL